jgi:hypothetical protein
MRIACPTVAFPVDIDAALLHDRERDLDTFDLAPNKGKDPDAERSPNPGANAEDVPLAYTPSTSSSLSSSSSIGAVLRRLERHSIISCKYWSMTLWRISRRASRAVHAERSVSVNN